MNDKKLKVAIYCRVGNDDQITINGQKTQLEFYCEKKGYEIYKSYLDNGYSANDKNRPSYKLMLEDMKQQKFNLILVSDISKLTRSMIDLYDLSVLLKDYNCKLSAVHGAKMEDLMYLRFSTKANAKEFYQLESRVMNNE